MSAKATGNLKRADLLCRNDVTRRTWSATRAGGWEPSCRNAQPFFVPPLAPADTRRDARCVPTRLQALRVAPLSAVHLAPFAARNKDKRSFRSSVKTLKSGREIFMRQSKELLHPSNPGESRSLTGGYIFLECSPSASDITQYLLLTTYITREEKLLATAISNGSTGPSRVINKALDCLHE